MAVVELDIREFFKIYPQFSDMAEETVTFQWDVAAVVVCPGEGSGIPYDPPRTLLRKTVLYMVLCHLLELSLRGNGLVGSLTSATEGSVSAGYTMPSQAASSSAWWWNQTQCGAAAWQILQRYMLGGRLYNGCFR